MYWTVLSMVTVVESTFGFILTWVPFYSWIRFFGHLYLVKPGGTLLYQTYVHPFLSEHEQDIDTFITGAHERAKAVGLQYLKQAIEWVKVNVMGLQPRPQTPPASRQGSYAQQLLGRFNLPSARDGLAAPAGDFYGLLASAVQMTTSSGGSRDMQAENLTASGTLIPPTIQSNEDRMNYVSAQRERLRVLLSAFDKEAFNLAGTSGPSAANRSFAAPDMSRERSSDALSKSRSEADFDKIEKEEVRGESQGKAAPQGGWMPWAWGGKAPAGSGPQETSGKSSGVDL